MSVKEKIATALFVLGAVSLRAAQRLVRKKAE